ncbi:MAG: hypothetical protein R3F43_15180 [bacterium]
MDRDGDGAFTPCGGLTGIDATWLQREDVRVVGGEVRRLEPLALVRQPCDAASETGLTGRILLQTEDGPVGSGRPVRARLLPHAGGPERSQLLGQPPGGGPRLGRDDAGSPPGRYDLIVYLDNDQDGVFTDCPVRPTGTGRPWPSTTWRSPEGRIVSLAARTLSLLGCPVPRAAAPAVQYDPGWGRRGPLRPIITERGLARAGRAGAAVGTRPPRAAARDLTLAPGEFQLEAWLDADRDEHPGGWTWPRISAVGRLVLRLDAMTPEADPILRLEPLRR